MSLPGVVSQLVGFVAQKLLPQPQADSANVGQNVRLGTYGEVAVNSYLSKKHAPAGEGSYFSTVTTPLGAVVIVPIVTAYANTAGCFWFQNNNAAGGPNAYLDYLKLVCQIVPASTTQFGYAIIRDVAQPLSGSAYLTTNHVGTAQPANTSGTGPQSKCLVGYSTSATATVNLAPTANAAVISTGALGGLPIIGDELIIDFGGDQAVSYGATSIASRKVSPTPAIVVAPGQQIMIVPWFVGNAATGAKFDLEFTHIER